MARIRKKAKQEGRTIVFVDEAGFYLLVATVMTYAPIGQTPILKVPLTWDHLSVIGAITPDGKLYIHVQDKAFKADAIVQFLKHLLRHIAGKLLVVWDGLPAHRGQVVKDFLKQGATQRLHLEQLPGYASDLNPIEGIWHYLKSVEMKNLWCQTLTDLHHQLRSHCSLKTQNPHHLFLHRASAFRSETLDCYVWISKWIENKLLNRSLKSRACDNLNNPPCGCKCRIIIGQRIIHLYQLVEFSHLCNIICQ